MHVGLTLLNCLWELEIVLAVKPGKKLESNVATLCIITANQKLGMERSKMAVKVSMKFFRFSHWHMKILTDVHLSLPPAKSVLLNFRALICSATTDCQKVNMNQISKSVIVNLSYFWLSFQQSRVKYPAMYHLKVFEFKSQNWLNKESFVSFT